MKPTKLIFTAALLATSVSLACMTAGTTSLTKDQINKRFNSKKRTPANTIAKFADGHPSPSLESQLGNLLINESARKVTISVPAVLLKSSYHQFPDGQTNAKMAMGQWTESGFPAVGYQVTANGKTERKYIFHPSLEITYYEEKKLPSGYYQVQPSGWKDSFYFSFDSSILPVSEFLKDIPETHRTFSGNRVAPDVAKVGKAFGTERFSKLGAGYNKAPWPADNVHGVFPDKNGAPTAIGAALSWGIMEKFKTLYTCFEPRDLAKEKSTGVPSGTGWHNIGDPAESLFNNLVTSPAPVAIARTHSLKNAAYGLTESITASWLQSDEVLFAPRGSFHWYLNPHETSVCIEVWAHKCEPTATNNRGFNCP